MTTARPTTSDDRIEFSTSNGSCFFTGNEISAIEEDPLLTIKEVAEYRTEDDR